MNFQDQSSLAKHSGGGAADVVWYHGYQVSWTRKRRIGGPDMCRPRNHGQEAHNRGGLEIIIR
jgi:hypothetical protein